MQEVNKDTKSKPEKLGDERDNLGDNRGTETGKGAEGPACQAEGCRLDGGLWEPQDENVGKSDCPKRPQATNDANSL